MRKIAALATAIAISGAAAACAGHAPVPKTQQAPLSGVWVPATSIAHSATDTSSGNRMAPEMPTGREQGGDRGGRGGYGGERGGYGAPRRTNYNFGAVDAALEAVSRGASRISIQDDGKQVHFRFADNSYFDLVPDGSSHDDVWRNVGRIKSMARWTETGLLLQRKLDQGVTVQQTFSRPAGADRLTVLTVVKGPIPRPVERKAEYVMAPRS